MAGVKPVTMGPFIRGIDASTGVLSQPKGSIPRGSNLLLSKRGSLRTCDGSLLVNAYNGVATLGRGKAMCDFFFAPTGVAGYYLRIMKALDQPLGAPKNLAVALAAGGTLTVAQAYFWEVTAIDGAGGETPVSNEVTVTPTSGNQTANLTWNKVPNASGYNIYRGLTTGNERMLIGVGIPVSTTSFSDNGSLSPGAALAVTNIAVIAVQSTQPPSSFSIYTVSVVFPTAVATQYQAGQTFVYTAGSDTDFNTITWKINAITSSSSLTATASIVTLTSPISLNEVSTGGTILIGTSPPIVDTTQQTALYAMPPEALGIR